MSNESRMMLASISEAHSKRDFEDLASTSVDLIQQLEAAKQRELELLAVIERKRQQIGKFVNLCEELIGSKDYVGTGSLKSAKAEEREDREKLKQIVSISETEPSQALREHEAKILEEAAEVFEIIGYAKFKTPADELRRMAEERRNNG